MVQLWLNLPALLHRLVCGASYVPLLPPLPGSASAFAEEGHVLGQGRKGEGRSLLGELTGTGLLVYDSSVTLLP